MTTATRASALKVAAKLGFELRSACTSGRNFTVTLDHPTRRSITVSGALGSLYVWSEAIDRMEAEDVRGAA